MVVVGEALIDRAAFADGRVEETPGGSPANVALALGRWGRAPQLVTHLGADAHGETLRRWLAESNVDVAAGSPAIRTSTALARIDGTGAARYEFDLTWEVDSGLARESDVLHIGSIATFIAPGADAVAALVRERRNGTLITYDPNIRPALISRSNEGAARAQVEEFIRAADVVKLSDEDVAWLRPGADPLAVARAWQAYGPAIVVVTSGGSGAFAVAAAGEVVVPAEPVTVVDTIGAGDTFMAGLIEGLLRADLVGSSRRDDLHAVSLPSLVTMLEFSAYAAAITVSRQGANPPWELELV